MWLYSVNCILNAPILTPPYIWLLRRLVPEICVRLFTTLCTGRILKKRNIKIVFCNIKKRRAFFFYKFPPNSRSTAPLRRLFIFNKYPHINSPIHMVVAKVGCCGKVLRMSLLRKGAGHAGLGELKPHPGGSTFPQQRYPQHLSATKTNQNSKFQKQHNF